ncbi:MAG: WecB/TagA/CpsF family glycosyltransferase [Caldimonas sp.]
MTGVDETDRVVPGLCHASARERFARRVVCLFGLPFDSIGLSAAVERIRAAALAGERCFVSTPNLNFLVAARTDPGFRDSVLRSDLSLADGAPIVWMARRMALPIMERVAGANVFDALRAHKGPPLTVFFFGGAPGVAAAAADRLNAVPGGLRCVGFDDAGHGSVEDMSTSDRIGRINDCNADFVVVSLGARKGQAWIERNASALKAPLLCHLGAVINFVAGTVSRAPAWAQRTGLEWLWRIKEEPSLWRRYWADGRCFLRLAGRAVLVGRQVQPADRSRIGPSTCHVSSTSSGDDEIGLSGAWTASDLGPLRMAIADAVEQSKAVVLTMRGVTFIDSAFVGLLLLARGSLGSSRFRLQDVPDAARIFIESNGAEFLLS